MLRILFLDLDHGYWTGLDWTRPGFLDWRNANFAYYFYVMSSVELSVALKFEVPRTFLLAIGSPSTDIHPNFLELLPEAQLLRWRRFLVILAHQHLSLLSNCRDQKTMSIGKEISELFFLGRPSGCMHQARFLSPLPRLKRTGKRQLKRQN
jgi:hypothetical protein